MLSLVSVDGHPLPFQVGVTTAGQPLIIYSGYAVPQLRNGKCTFAVDLDRGDALSFTGEYHATVPGLCVLTAGEPRSFTYTFPFRNITADSARTYVYQ